jgi:hypothetical protein
MEDVAATPPSVKKKSAGMAVVASFEGGSDRKAQVKIKQDPDTYDHVPDATVKTCWRAADARELLQAGLTRGLSACLVVLQALERRTLADIFFTMQLLYCSNQCSFVVPKETRDSTAVDRRGITIDFLDMACIERLKKGSRTAGGAIDSVASTSSWSAVLHCLHTREQTRS